MKKSLSRKKKKSACPHVPGVSFKDERLLEAALTHPSCQEPLSGRKLEDFNRLEFLGDSVLNLVVSCKIFSLFRALPEGDLSRYRAALVSRRNLAEIGRSLELGKLLRTGKGMPGTGKMEDKILADAFEAVVGAVYLDGGMKKAGAFVSRLFKPYWEPAHLEAVSRDPKSSLQELCQSRWKRLPEYSWSSCAAGLRCLVRIEEFEAAAEGRSKKESAEKAAALLLARVGI